MSRFTASLAFVLTLAAAGCLRSNRCQPGISLACACSDGTTGAQVCGDDSRLAPCVCADGTVSDGGSGNESDGGGGLGGGGGNGGDGGFAGGGGSGGGGSGGAGGGGGSDAGGPMVLSFGANTTMLSPSQSVTFTALVTHPDGIADLAGGSLMTADGNAVYGSFDTTGQQLTLTLSWDQIEKTLAITFSTSETRTFDAVFFDRQGRRANATAVVTLTCSGAPACQGVCLGSGVPLPSGCNVQWLPAATPTACNDVCAAASRLCTPSCAPPPPDPVAAVVARYKSSAGYYVYGDMPDCTSVPPLTDNDGTALTYVDQTCCCY